MKLQKEVIKILKKCVQLFSCETIFVKKEDNSKYYMVINSHNLSFRARGSTLLIEI